MTTKTIFCNDCNVREAEFTFLDIKSMKDIALCETCYNDRFYQIADEGINFFMEWATANYGNETAWNIAYQLYGDDRVNEYRNCVGGAGEELLTMFTYGILKYPHNIKREGGIDIVENCTVSGHRMFIYNNSFPVTELVRDPECKVYGTLFKIPKSQVLYSYDVTEGYDPKGARYHNMYNRDIVKVTTPNGEIVDANMYIANPLMFRKDFIEYNYVPTGNFDDTVERRRKNRKGVR